MFLAVLSFPLRLHTAQNIPCSVNCTHSGTQQRRAPSAALGASGRPGMGGDLAFTPLAGSRSTGLPLRSGHSSAAVSSCAHGSNEPFPNLGRLEVAPGVRTPDLPGWPRRPAFPHRTGSPPGLRWRALAGPGWVRQWCPRWVRWARCSALLLRGPDHESVKRGVFAAGSMLRKAMTRE